MPTYVVTSHTAMILLAILALLLSSATDTASQNATGTASLNTMVRRSGPVADLSVPLVALDPNSQYSLLYSLTSLTGLGRDARVEVEVRQGNAVLASKTLHAGDADYYTQFRVPKAGPATVVVRPTHASGNYALSREPMAAYGAGQELACAALAGRGEDSARPDGVRIGRRRELRAASRYDAAHAGHARRFHRLVPVRVHVRHAQARLLPGGPDGAGPDSRRRGRLSPRQRRAARVFRRRGSR